jgi:hypothetical protein
MNVNSTGLPVGGIPLKSPVWVALYLAERLRDFLLQEANLADGNLRMHQISSASYQCAYLYLQVSGLIGLKNLWSGCVSDLIVA